MKYDNFFALFRGQNLDFTRENSKVSIIYRTFKKWSFAIVCYVDCRVLSTLFGNFGVVGHYHTDSLKKLISLVTSG